MNPGARLMRRMTAGERRAYPDGKMIQNVMMDGRRADLIVTAYGVAVCDAWGGEVYFLPRPDMEQCETSRRWKATREMIDLALRVPSEVTGAQLVEMGFTLEGYAGQVLP